MSESTFLTEFHSGFGLPRSTVVDLAQKATGRPVTDLQRVMRGDENEVYRAALDDGSAVFCRIRVHRGSGMPAEAEMMHRAREAGVPVPAVVALTTITTDDGQREAMVLAEAAGTQLVRLLPTLSRSQRQAAMVGIGEAMAKLHTVGLPGSGRPDADGVWPDPTAHWTARIAARKAQQDVLLTAGLSSGDVAEAYALLDRAGNDVPGEAPVLCHGDLSPEHVFVDDSGRVSAIIDWGLWTGGTPIDDLAWIAMNQPASDFAAVVQGYGGYEPDDPTFHNAVRVAIIERAIGGIAWNDSIGNSEAVAAKAAAFRRALAGDS